jgi:hypothetical protein
MVKVNLPPPQRNVNPQTITLPANTKLRRIYDPTRFKAICPKGLTSCREALSFRTAIGFRSYGPVSRFDHHSSNEPSEDSRRRIIYAGFSLSCCIVEYFGDGEIINLENIRLAIIYLNKELKLLDLRGKAAMAAGTVTAISAITQRKITQAWGRYFYEHIELYDRVDGLIFSGAHNGEDAIALYERAEAIISSSKVKEIDLKSETLRSTILKIADEHGLEVETY